MRKKPRYFDFFIRSCMSDWRRDTKAKARSKHAGGTRKSNEIGARFALAPPQPKGEVKCTMPMDCLRPASGAALCFDIVHAETRDRTGDLQIFSLTLSQLSYRGS